MQLLKDIDSARDYRRETAEAGKTIGFVPTMGGLHDGHLKLVDVALEHADLAVGSIYVNPTQFGENEDLDAYPRQLEADLAGFEKRGCDAVFMPSDEQMYGSNFQTYVVPGEMSKGLCGADRPIHFRGVCTIVTKLFNILRPDVAVFGEKDFQQVRIIEQLVEDLNFETKIVRGPLVREEDGLAMSTRNKYMTSEQRQRAVALSRGIAASKTAFAQGRRRAEDLVTAVTAELAKQQLGEQEIDYIRLVDSRTLTAIEQADEQSRLAMAVRVGASRLLDNTGFSPSEIVD